MPIPKRHNWEQGSCLEALKASEERFRLAVNFSHDWEYWEATDGGYVYVSPSCARITGYTADEFLREPDIFTRIAHPDDRASLEHHREHERSSPGTHSLNYRIINRAGEERWIGHVCQRVYSRTGEWLGWRGSNRDITSQKDAHAAMILAEKLTTTRELAGALAQEINNPLQSAMGCLDLALEALNRGRDPQRYLDVVCQELGRAADVTGRLRSLHQLLRVEERRPMDLGHALECALVLSREKFQSQGVAVSLDLDPDLPPVPLQVDAMQHAFLNVLFHALDAVPHGGELRIEVAGGCQGVCIHFAHTGTGSPAATADNPVEPHPNAGPKGLDLNLLVSQSIVQHHGGQMEVEPSQGNGTILSLWLPT